MTTTECAILYDRDLPFYIFKNKQDGLIALNSFALARLTFLEQTIGMSVADSGYRLDVMTFNASGLCVASTSYIYTNKLQQEELLDANIASLEKECDKLMQTNETSGKKTTTHDGMPTRKKSQTAPIATPNTVELEKEKNKISIFCSNKGTYVKIKRKIDEGILHLGNIPALFSDKYMLYKFLDENNLISFSCDTNATEEFKLFEQLYKIIEASDLDIEIDPIADIKNENTELCFKFLQYLENNGGVPTPEKKLHSLINKTTCDDIFDADYNEDEDETT